MLITGGASVQAQFFRSGHPEDDGYSPPDGAVFNDAGHVTVLVGKDGSRYTVRGNDFEKSFSSRDSDNFTEQHREGSKMKIREKVSEYFSEDLVGLPLGEVGPCGLGRFERVVRITLYRPGPLVGIVLYLVFRVLDLLDWVTFSRGD